MRTRSLRKPVRLQ